MFSFAVSLIPIVILVVFLIASIIVFAVYRSNQKHLQNVVEGKETGRHTNVPDIGQIVSSITKAIVIVFLIIGLIATASIISMLDTTVNELDNQIMNLKLEVQDLNEAIAAQNLPYSEVRYEFTEVDMEKNTMDVVTRINLKKAAKDTTVTLSFNDGAYRTQLRHEKDNWFVGETTVSFFDTLTDCKALIVTDGVSESTDVADFSNIEGIELFNYYRLSFMDNFEYKNGKVKLNGVSDIFCNIGVYDDTSKISFFYVVDGKELDRVDLTDKLTSDGVYSANLDKSFDSNQVTVIVETELTNGLKIQNIVTYTYESMGLYHTEDKVAFVDANGSILAEY